MNRRDFLKCAVAGSIGVAWARSKAASGSEKTPQDAPVPNGFIRTVRGPVAAGSLGLALAHEHVMVDFAAVAETGPHRYDADEVVRVALPHLEQARDLGADAVFECTPAFLARDPVLLRRLSEATGLHLVTNTGLYGAARDKHLPAYAFTETSAELARRWTLEARDGIAGTGIRPGFIKCGVDADPQLSEVDAKLVDAAALTHLETGLAIAIHTGRGPGLAQLDMLRGHGVGPEAWIWIHAQNADDDTLFAAADRGAWLSLDGINTPSLTRHLHLCREMKSRGHLGRVLLSHDAGWYRVGEPGGGRFRDYSLLFTTFLPLLRENGFTSGEVERLLVANPADAFTIRTRPL